ncbi:hypothetical protein AB0I10_14455 [Streptomyces sp. NPDC050636]|uniref:hypothetical protein n=1 Tax=Streptomyces sp. NPDC050636 TaxID=3154510 RepID=UPI00342D0D4E
MARANDALQAYAVVEGGWRQTPSQNLQDLLVDLMQWCDATQHGFERALGAARERYAGEGAGGGCGGGNRVAGGGGQLSAG